MHGQHKTAIDIYQQVLLFKPDYIEAYSGMADAYYAIKDYSNAEKNYSKVIQLNPDNKYAYQKLQILKSMKQ
jgi:tetratricopeptide (TPR) repeat protein